MAQEFSFGRWIRKRRLALGLTQEALAERVGYSVAMLRKIENDERRPAPDGAALLAEALAIPAEEQPAFLEVARQERAVDRLGVPAADEPFPWQAPARPRTNLPLAATLLVGREGELAHLDRLLQDPGCRLITLVGLAGVGKTRLAVQAAHDQLDRFADGVFFVPLAPLATADMIAAAVANAVGFHFHGPAEPQAQLLPYLGAKQMLLVLDNFEHLLAGATLLPQIMQAAPGIHLLVTSQERLNLLGECVFEVEGLPYPPAGDAPESAALEGYGAVQLFLQGAVRADPAFRLNEANRVAVARICQLVAGIPLGIELAAAWVRALAVQDIAQEIETNLDFLKASLRDVPDRHRSVRAALDHSWNLLSAQEKDVFRRLSVFRGGFGRAAAQKVAGAGLEEIASLLDKSLLRRVGEARYDLHELVRQYAAGHLQANGAELARVRDRHSSAYAARLEQWANQIRGPDQMDILAEMEGEIDNVRLAWRWMVARQQSANIQKSLRCLWNFHEIRARFREGAALFAEAVAALEAANETAGGRDASCTVVLGQVLAQEGYFLAHLDRYDEARERLARSMALLEAPGDRDALADTLAILGFTAYRLGEFAAAGRYTEESLALQRAADNQNGIIFCLIVLAYINLAQGAFEQAHALASESLVICRDQLGDLHGTADCLITLSAAARRLGQFHEARRWASESLQISQSLDDRWGVAQTLRQLALISLELGEIERAESLIRQGVSQAREIGDRTLLAAALITLGLVTRATGDVAAADQAVREALQTAVESQTPVIALSALVEMAEIKLEAGRPERALELALFCLEQPATNREARSQAERLRAALAAQLPRPQVDAALARVQGRSPESLVEEILAAG